MRTQLFGWFLAASLAMVPVALATSGAAQNPPSQPPQSPRPTQTQRPVAKGSEGLVTIEGCLRREADVPGRIPATPEKAGVSGDYLVTRAKVIKGDAPATLTGMFEVEEIDRGQLESYVGQRVQIDGWFDDLERVANPSGRRSENEAIEIRGSAIRAVAKDCPN